MLRIIAFFVVCATLVALPSKEVEQETLHVLAYDSFVAEWGIGPHVEALAEEEFDIDLVYINGGDTVAAVQLATQYAHDDPQRPDVIIGIDNNMIPLVEDLDILQRTPIVSDVYNTATLPDYLVPFNFGYFAIVYDAERVAEPPRSLLELSDARFKDSLVLMHPSSSSPGLSFLYWTIAAFGESGYLSYWDDLKPSILTITDSWETGYGIFSAGEAPLVLSYTTSPAYHIEFEQEDRYKAARFAEGHYIQIEGAGVSIYAKDPELATRFVLFLQEISVQEAIPLRNFMYPVRTDLELPASFQSLERDIAAIHLSSDSIAAKSKEWLDSWKRLMSK